MINNKKLIIFLGFTVLVIIVSIILNNTLFKPPEIISSYPEDNSSNVDLTSPITLTFSKNINLNQLELRSSEEESFNLKIDGKTVTAEHEQIFYSNKQYNINVYYENELIYVLSFSTLKQQSDPRVTQEIQKKVEEKYPLADTLPYKTQNYSVVYSDELALEIELFNQDLDKNSVIQEIKTWVSSKNIDPETHQYVFKPEPYPTTYRFGN